MDNYVTVFNKKATIMPLSPDRAGNIILLHEDGMYRIHSSQTGKALEPANISYDIYQYTQIIKEDPHNEDPHYGVITNNGDK